MELEHRFSFALSASPNEAPKLLLTPERVFSALPGIKGLKREGSRLSGELCGEAPFFGEVCFPFESLLEQEGPTRARLTPLPLAEKRFWAELAGLGALKEGELHYDVRLVLHAELPEGEKWGGRAFRRMVEAALSRHLSRALSALPKRVELG